MKFRQLEYFVQIVESGSLAKAAKKLFVVQPALSQQIAKLEEEIGKKLLIRSVKGVTVTDNGAALYQHAKFVLRQMDQAVKIARYENDVPSGIVAVGLAPTTGAAVGLALIQHIWQKYPSITLNVIEGMSTGLENMLKANQLDIAIRFTNSTVSDLDVSLLLEEDLFVMVPEDSPLVPAFVTEMTLSDAAKLPLLLPTGMQGLRPRITQEIERIGMIVHPIAEIGSLPLLLACVTRGMGATIQPMAAALVESSTPKLRCIRLSGEMMTRKNYLYSLQSNKLSKSALLVKEEIRDVITDLITSGRWPGARMS